MGVCELILLIVHDHVVLIYPQGQLDDILPCSALHQLQFILRIREEDLAGLGIYGSSGENGILETRSASI